jgi:hypothetical protein
MVDSGMAFEKRVEFGFGLPLNLPQQPFGWENSTRVQRPQHALTIGEEKRVADIEKQSRDWHGFSLNGVVPGFLRATSCPWW